MARDRSKDVEDETVERMLDRFRRGLLTREELDSFLDLQRRRAELREKVLEAGREPFRLERERKAS